MAKKLPLLALVLQEGTETDKDKATALILCNNVYVNGQLCSDPKALFPQDSLIEVKFPKYVSRGGFKLEKALEDFSFEVKGKTFIDAGSSTGGFSDCLLQHGAEHVCCVDVGYNLLDYKIRSNPKVEVFEKTNIMAFDKMADRAVADLSFRSINGAARHVLSLTKDNIMVALIKPQFELPRWQADFTGVVESSSLLCEILDNIYEILKKDNVGIYKATVSPIKGHKGNTEFLALLRLNEKTEEEPMKKDDFVNLSQEIHTH